MPVNWELLGEGSFNRAYKSIDGKEVLKIQKTTDATDTPERSVRLWNVINAHVPPPARLEASELGMGWVCPFIKGKQASDKEMACALVEIFNNTGRIIVDATAPKNFIRTPTGEIVCVDVGMALQFEQREDSAFAAVRRKSFVSLKMWDSHLRTRYNDFFKECEVTNPETVNTVKALVFIKDNRPDMQDVSFLKDNQALVKKIAKAYDAQVIIPNQGDRLAALSHLNMITNPKTFAIPQDKVILKVKDFVSYLRSIDPSFVISDEKVKDMSLSATYENSSDSNKPYVNIEIYNPAIENLYLLQQAQLAVKKLYSSKLEKISMIQKAATADPKLSETEKIFIKKYHDKLIQVITAGVKETRIDLTLEEIQNKIEKNLEISLNEMLNSAQKITRTVGLRGFMNDNFKALGWRQPFHITNSSVVHTTEEMKRELLTFIKEKVVVDDARGEEGDSPYSKHS